MIAPNQVKLPRIGILTATLDRAEPEAVGAVIVRWHHVHSPEEWSGIALDDFVAFVKNDEVCQTWHNPIWTQTLIYGMHAVLDKGFVEGWVRGEPDSIGHVTEAFLERIERSMWASS